MGPTCFFPPPACKQPRGVMARATAQGQAGAASSTRSAGQRESSSATAGDTSCTAGSPTGRGAPSFRRRGAGRWSRCQGRAWSTPTVCGPEDALLCCFVTQNLCLLIFGSGACNVLGMEWIWKYKMD